MEWFTAGAVKFLDEQNGVQPDFAWATWLDDGIGLLMKKLQDMGIEDNLSLSSPPTK